MTNGVQFTIVIASALVTFALLASKAVAAQCGSTAAGFEEWKRQFADELPVKSIAAGEQRRSAWRKGQPA